MTFDHFVRRNGIIAQYLSEIAIHSEKADSDGVLEPLHTHFRAVMLAQQRLLDAVDRLLDSLPDRTIQ
jgi:hypothetical protein